MRFQKTPTDELISGTCYEVRNLLRYREEILTPEAVNHLVEDTAYRCIMYETERHAVSQDNILFQEIILTYDRHLVSQNSHYETRFGRLPNCPPFSTFGGFDRCLGHLMNKVVGGVIGELRDPPLDGIEPIQVTTRLETSREQFTMLSTLPLESDDHDEFQNKVTNDIANA